MGSSATCIITREKINVPREIPHFWKKDVLTIPVDCEQWGVIDFLKFYKEGELIFVESDQMDIDEDSEDDYEPESLSAEAIAIYNFLKDLGLLFKKFIVMYSSDHADIPTEGFHGAFDGGNLIAGTHYSDYEDIPGEIDAALDALEISYSHIHHFDYYHRIATEYVENIFKPGLWRP